MSILDRFRLDGHQALVTGAGRGIGKAIALALADAGADVACAARTQTDIDEVAAAIRNKGRNGVALNADVGTSSTRETLIENTVSKLGGLSILVNNAGGAGPNDPLTTSAEQFARTLDFNVVPAFDLSRLAAPHLAKANNASILNISSMAAHLRQKNFSAYGSAKAALTQMTRLLAQDFAPGIRVNAIEPGPVSTEALEQYMTPEMKAHMVAAIPLGRLGDVEDIAAAAVYLAAPSSSWVSGKVLELDGGTEAPW